MVTIVEGRYYETAEGRLEGPMEVAPVFISTESSTIFKSGVMNTTERGLGESPQYWTDSGDVYLRQNIESRHHIVKEVAKPGFKLENGKHYILADGQKAGPFEGHGNGTFTVDGFLCDVSNFPGSNLPPHQVWEEDGTIDNPMPGEDMLDVVREYDPKDNLIVTLQVSEEMKELVETVRKEIEAAAGKALEEVAAKDQELRAAKDAFNISCEENRALKLRIETYDALVVEKNKTISTIALRLDALRDSVGQREDTIESLEGAVLSLQGQLTRERQRKERGDVRLREARRRLASMAKKADEAELNLSKRVTFDVGNFIFGVVALAAIATAGAGFGAWLF